MKPLLVALACGWGQQPMLDPYGNSTCVQAARGNPEAILTLQQLPEVMAKVRANQEAGRTPELRSVLPGPDN